MSFLKCLPSIFVIGSEYEILIYAKSKGLFSVLIAGERFYSENSGALSTEKDYAKIRVPQKILDKAKNYEIAFKKTIERKAYFSLMGEEERIAFVFKPLEKTKDIHIYHIADVHYAYETAIKTASYFGDDTDLFIVNGDIGEVETEENYFETSAFVGEISQGKIPVIFTRGNHDTRGNLAEVYTERFSANGKDCFFTFELGCLSGIVLDCGEDKRDNHTDEQYENPNVYGGVNAFEAYRQRELAWLKQIPTLNERAIKFAISHICPVQATTMVGSVFDIERDCYRAINVELERLKTGFMLCGHEHEAFLLSPNESKIMPHDYPVIVGSELRNTKYINGKAVAENFCGAALIVNFDKIEVLFTDQNHTVVEFHEVVLAH